jgi:hypothetical protein
MPRPEAVREHIRILVEIKTLRAGREEAWMAGRDRLIAEAQALGVRPRALREAIEGLPPEEERYR